MFKNRIVGELMAAARGKRSEHSHEEGREEGSELQERLRTAVSEAERFISKYPLAILGSALVAGVLVGWWVKRK